MSEEDPRDQEIYCEALDTWFPAPSLFDDLDPTSKKNAEYFADAPWFRRDVCTNHREILENYTDRNGRLPGGIPLVGTEKWTWLNQFTYTKEALHLVEGRNKTSVVGEMAITINKALKRFFTYEVPARDARVDMFVYRTRGEIDYVQNLGSITNAQLERWYSQSIIDPEAYKLPKPQIYVNFRFLKKSLSQYWREEVRQERRLRSSHGWFLP